MLYKELQRISKLRKRLAFVIILLSVSVYLNILKYHEYEFVNEENRILSEQFSEMEQEIDSLETVLNQQKKDTLPIQPKVKKIVKKETPKELIDTNKNNLDIKVIENTAGSDLDRLPTSDTLNR